MTEQPTPWFLAPEALTLIASMRRNPPRLEQRTRRYTLSTDHWSVHTGTRVKRLRAIFNEGWSRLGPEDTDARRAYLAYGDADDVVNAVLGRGRREPFLGMDRPAGYRASIVAMIDNREGEAA